MMAGADVRTTQSRRRSPPAEPSLLISRIVGLGDTGGAFAPCENIRDELSERAKQGCL